MICKIFFVFVFLIVENTCEPYYMYPSASGPIEGSVNGGYNQNGGYVSSGGSAQNTGNMQNMQTSGSMQNMQNGGSMQNTQNSYANNNGYWQNSGYSQNNGYDPNYSYSQYYDSSQNNGYYNNYGPPQNNDGYYQNSGPPQQNDGYYQNSGPPQQNDGYYQSYGPPQQNDAYYQSYGPPQHSGYYQNPNGGYPSSHGYNNGGRYYANYPPAPTGPYGPYQPVHNYWNQMMTNSSSNNDSYLPQPKETTPKMDPMEARVPPPFLLGNLLLAQLFPWKIGILAFAKILLKFFFFKKIIFFFSILVLLLVLPVFSAGVPAGFTQFPFYPTLPPVTAATKNDFGFPEDLLGTKYDQGFFRNLQSDNSSNKILYKLRTLVKISVDAFRENITTCSKDVTNFTCHMKTFLNAIYKKYSATPSKIIRFLDQALQPPKASAARDVQNKTSEKKVKEEYKKIKTKKMEFPAKRNS